VFTRLDPADSSDLQVALAAPQRTSSKELLKEFCELSGEGCNPDSDGFFIAWVNGRKKLDHRGPTLYAGMSCYLKLANYHRPDPAAARSVIHDRIVRGTTAESVSLTPLRP
jgi:hypothetical protein